MKQHPNETNMTFDLAQIRDSLKKWGVKYGPDFGDDRTKSKLFDALDALEYLQEEVKKECEEIQ